MKRHKSLKLVSWGKYEWERTKEFRSKISQIRREVLKKHAKIFSDANILKKLWLRFLMELEIRKEIRKISSHKNLHIGFDLYHG